MFLMTDKSNVTNRGNSWNSGFAFIMAMIGSAVGLGNIWRFNYVVYSNGGMAFFIPYLIAICVMAIPFLMVEYSLGYHFKASIASILKKIRSYFEVVGWFVLFLIFLILTYYVVIIGWDVIYLVLSFVQGWGSDPNMFFMNNIVVGGNNLDSISTFVLPVTIFTILVWFICWFISHRELNDGLGRVVNFLIPLLFIMMAIIVFYSLTLPGHMIGIGALFDPDWSALLDMRIWIAAFGQVFFSLSVGQSIGLTYASYLPSNKGLIDKVLTVAVANSSFEIFTAVGVFSILGFMSITTGVPVGEIATSGSGLLFIVFPQVFNIMGPVSYIIGPLFFGCVLFAGLTSALSLIEPLANSIAIKFGLTRKRATSIICLLGAIISLVYTTGSGSYVLDVVDGFVNNFGILLGVVLQTIIVSRFYGLENLIPDLNNSRIHVGKTWMFIIKWVLPVLLMIMWVAGIIDLFASETTLTLILQMLLALSFVIVPVVLTKLPDHKSEDDVTKT